MEQNTPVNSNGNISDWLEYLWDNKDWYNHNFGDALEKVFTIFSAIWTHRTNIIIRNHNCNLIWFLKYQKDVSRNGLI